MYLRTHTTAVSARMLYRVAQETVFVPQKLFSIGNYSNKLIISPLFMKTPPPSLTLQYWQLMWVSVSVQSLLKNMKVNFF